MQTLWFCIDSLGWMNCVQRYKNKLVSVRTTLSSPPALGILKPCTAAEQILKAQEGIEQGLAAELVAEELTHVAPFGQHYRGVNGR